MAEPVLEGPFGDLGLATYDEETQEWRFSRRPDEHYTLVKAANDRLSGEKSCTSDGDPPSSVHGDELQRTVAAYPELQAAADILPPLLRVSHYAIEAVNQFDCAIASRLSLGYLYDRGHNRTAVITASVSGQTGSDVTITKLRWQQQRWSDPEHALLNVPVLSGLRTIWKGSGTPIRQLLLARATVSEGPAPFLAARLPRSTLIFRLALTRDGLDVYPVHEVSQDGAYPSDHADVAFNPWYPRQYATIDMAGSWNVWQLEKTKLEPIRIVQHNVPIQPATRGLQDGWRKMHWVGSPTTLVICSRTDIRLYSIEDGILLLEDVDAQLQQPDCWILDIAVDPNMPSVLFVLTGSHFLAYEVEVKHDGTVVRKLVVLRHYFNPSDLTLRLHVTAEGSGIMIFLISKLYQIGVGYKLENITGSTPTLAGPHTLDALASISSGSRFNMIVLPVKPAQPSPAPSQGALHVILTDTLGTYQIIYLKDDFDIGHQLIRTAYRESDPMIFDPPHRLRRRATNTTTSVHDASVIEGNDDDTGIQRRQQRPVSRFVRRLRQVPQDRHGLEWTIDLSRTAQELLSLQKSSSASIRETLKKAREAIVTGQNDGDRPLRLLHELDKGTDVEDLDEINSTLQTLNTSHQSLEDTDQPRLKVATLPMPQIDAVAGLADLSTNYDQIISDWIRTLPAIVSGRIRLMREKIARQMAAELTLASHVLRTEQQQPILETQEEGEPPTYQLDLPFRDVPPTVNEAAGFPSQEVSALPTPSPTATPSTTTRASQASTYASQQYYITNITTFAKPLPVSLPRSTQRVLRHWEVGADLDSYDWRSYSRRITRQTEMEELDSQLTEQQRARIQRKTERHLKRERKEAAATLQQQTLSSQLPELVVSASQPVDRTGHSQPGLNSSQTQPIAVSQAVQGRHGGRPAKKKRKQGF